MESMRSDGYYFLGIIIIAVMLLLIMSLTLVLFFYLSRKKIVKKELEKQQLVIHHQKEMIHAGIETQEEERKRIAQDLHDDISSKLNVVSLNTQFLIEESKVLDEESRKMLQQVQQITAATLEASRKIAHNLLPPVLEKFGLGAAIGEVCDEYNNSKKLLITYKNTYQEGFLGTQAELHVFRVVQELLNNSVKHGKATEINLDITIADKSLILVYKDNGAGFNVEEAVVKKGLGLRNINTRIELLKGVITYKSSPGKGVLATIKI